MQVYFVSHEYYSVKKYKCVFVQIIMKRELKKQNKTKREQDDNERKRQLRFQKRKTPGTDFLSTSLHFMFLKHSCISVDPDKNCMSK